MFGFHIRLYDLSKISADTYNSVPLRTLADILLRPYIGENEN